MVSPLWATKAFTFQPALATEALKQDVPTMLLAGWEHRKRQRPESLRDRRPAGGGIHPASSVRALTPPVHWPLCPWSLPSAGFARGPAPGLMPGRISTSERLEQARRLRDSLRDFSGRKPTFRPKDIEAFKREGRA